MRVPRLPRGVRYALAIAIALAIGYASVTKTADPVTDPSLLGVRLDRWLHGSAYAVLSGALGYAALPAHGRVPARALMAVLFTVLGYGIGVELIQISLPYRTFALADLVANAVGSALGLLPIAAVGRRWLS